MFLPQLYRHPEKFTRRQKPKYSGQTASHHPIAHPPSSLQPISIPIPIPTITTKSHHRHTNPSPFPSTPPPNPPTNHPPLPHSPRSHTPPTNPPTQTYLYSSLPPLPLHKRSPSRRICTYPPPPRPSPPLRARFIRQPCACVCVFAIYREKARHHGRGRD